MSAARIAVTALGCILTLAAARAQSPAFDSVSVTPNTSGASTRSLFRLMPDGGVRAVNVTPLDLIQSAYQRHAFDRRQIEGGPAWIHTDRFDVEARASGGHDFEADA